MSVFFRTALVIATILVAGCGSDLTPSTDDNSAVEGELNLAELRQMIGDRNQEFGLAHVTGDSTIMINYYTEDAKIFAPNAETISGRPAIAELNSQYAGYDIKEFTEETERFYGSGDYVIDEGTYYMRYGADDIVEEGKYVNVWKKENGEWRVYANIWNANPS